jgi:hypothetical protein
VCLSETFEINDTAGIDRQPRRHLGNTGRIRWKYGNSIWLAGLAIDPVN